MDVQAYEQVDLIRFEAALRSPRAVDTPACIRNLQVQSGLNLLSTDLRLTRPAVVEAETFPSVCLSVVLDGYAQGKTAGIDTGFRPGEFWISSTNDRVSTRKVILSAHPVRTVELVVTPQWFEFVQTRFGGDPAFDAMGAAVERATVTRRRPLDARLKQIARSIQHSTGSGFATALYLESRALDLLAALAAEFQGGGERPAVDLKAPALERVVAVREQIDRDPAVATTITALAAAFAVSPSKLKQDFSAAFGVGLGRYIHERRLQFGRELVEDHGVTVSEAAYRCGYGQPANFTTAFKRRFGRPPSAVRRFS